MKRNYIYIILALALGLGACSKVSELDIDQTPVKSYPDGLSFRASLSAVTKASFNGDRSGKLSWDGDEDVAIVAVPVTDTKGMSYDHLHEYNLSGAISGFASVEVDEADPSMAILHTAKTLEDWTKDMTRVQFFAVYPANGVVPNLNNDTDTEDGTKFLYLLKDIPTEQDGVNYQKAMVLGGGSHAYYVENGNLVLESGGEAVDPGFYGFISGNAIFSFTITNGLDSDMDIASVKISTVQLDDLAAHYNEPEQMMLSGTQAVFYDDYQVDPEDEEDKYGYLACHPYNPDGTCSLLKNYVNVTFPETVSIAAGQTSGQIFNVSVAAGGEFKPQDVPGYIRFEAMDAEGNVLAVCDKPYPNYIDLVGKRESHVGIEQGIRYNFNVNFGEDSPYHFFVSSQPEEAGGWGENTVNGFVRSYKMEAGVATYVEWDYDGVFADPACTQAVPQEEWDKWLKSWDKVSPQEGESATDAYEATVTVKANPNPWVLQTYDCRAEVKNALSATAEKGSTSSYYNLSNSTGAATIENTANCYVINGPGYYTFPCVLGNGIKSGTVNSGAWTAVDNPDASHGLSVLFDYTGSNITSPFVHNSSAAAGTPTSAILLWEDVQGLIETSDNSLVLEKDASGVYWVQFHIGSANINQGNAVIAVKDESGTIMWSWHLWVTGRPFDGTDDTNIDGVQFSPVNLGWVETERLSGMTKEGNLAYVRIRQLDENGKTAVVKISQKPEENSWCEGNPADGYNPLYQFGRKDPMIPGKPSQEMSAGTNVPVYGTVTSLDCETYSKAQTTSSIIPHHYAIQNPHKLIFATIEEDKERYSWSYDIIFNSWNLLAGKHKGIEEYDEQQRKSVYDPCPVGYQVPQAHDFLRFHCNNDVTYYDEENDKDRLLGYSYDPTTSPVYAFSVKGMYLYTDDSRYNTIFFPLCGGRTVFGNGTLLMAFDKGPAYWSAAGLGNNQEDVNTGAEWLTLFLAGTEVDLRSDYEYTNPEIPFTWVDTFMPQGSAGFIRPVADRSTAITPSTPVFGGGTGAGSYTDVNF